RNGTAEGGPVLRNGTAEGGPVLRSTAEGGPVLRSTAEGGRRGTRRNAEKRNPLCEPLHCNRPTCAQAARVSWANPGDRQNHGQTESCGAKTEFLLAGPSEAGPPDSVRPWICLFPF